MIIFANPIVRQKQNSQIKKCVAQRNIRKILLLELHKVREKKYENLLWRWRKCFKDKNLTNNFHNRNLYLEIQFSPINLSTNGTKFIPTKLMVEVSDDFIKSCRLHIKSMRGYVQMLFKSCQMYRYYLKAVRCTNIKAASRIIYKISLLTDHCEKSRLGQTSPPCM